MKRLSSYEAKWLKIRRTTTTTNSGDVFIPIKTYLGVYYLRFQKFEYFHFERYQKTKEYFVVSRTSELEPAGNDVFVCEAYMEEVKSNTPHSNKGFWIPLEELKVIMKMIKKLK